MKIEKISQHGVTRVKPYGILAGGKETEDLNNLLWELEKNGIIKCIVDFSDIRWMNCRALGYLMERKIGFSNAGKELLITNMNERVKSLFNLTGLSEYFQIDSFIKGNVH